MKARVKETGEIVEVEKTILRGVECYINTTGEKIGSIYMESDLDFGFGCDYAPDYWERIKHQAMIAAMQAIITNPIGFEHVRASNQGRCMSEDVADIAKGYAADLVSKMKEGI